MCEHVAMWSKVIGLARGVAAASIAGLAVTSVACSSSGSRPSANAPCEQGKWVSSGMVAPAQAGIVDAKATGGGDGAAITFAADGTFLVDFGRMKPTAASFTTNGQPAVLAVQFSGVGKGVWKAASTPVTASFADLTTVHATATITLGATVPPIFDASWQQVDQDLMLGGAHMGVFTVSSCDSSTLVMSMPFPNGTLTATARRA
jgi:hypothetical protein